MPHTALYAFSSQRDFTLWIYAWLFAGYKTPPSAQEYQNPPSSAEKSVMGFKKKNLFNNMSWLRKHYLEEQPEGAAMVHILVIFGLCVCVETKIKLRSSIFSFPINCFFWWCFKSRAYFSAWDGLYRHCGSFQLRTEHSLLHIRVIKSELWQKRCRWRRKVLLDGVGSKMMRERRAMAA